ncbi:hypothetical protein GJR96_10955 [Haloferax sp. MBLA0076]|uniref:Uncharacterized protein n=1 Tax=Haloferax litoreum TaxID=2666140 RepID=A0A6A8GGI7_9EURY|nr:MULTISPECIES: hypothetical protein [Haloferax]KAB1193929.1 hypothetical protein Hfx1148_10915 [Haloferax sp. CBA1148]MRX22474.1 hypothetical protein [Haloferax litoreum]
MGTDTPSACPRLEPGVMLLRRPREGRHALHRLVTAELARRDGSAYWVDSRNDAVTHALYEHAQSRRTLRGLRIARAFTAYQHHELVSSLPGRVSSRTALIVVPQLPALYRDPDVPAGEARTLFDSAVTILDALAESLSVPILVTAREGTDDQFSDVLANTADRTVECRDTREGVAFTGEDVQTLVYHHRGYWQTTIPYWVELLGVAPEGDLAHVGPTTVPTLDAVAAEGW